MTTATELRSDKRTFMTSTSAASPDEPDLSTLPVRSDKRMAADCITRFYFPVSYRSLERWGLTWRIVNGRSVCLTADALAEAKRRLDASPAIRGGRRAA